MKAWVREDGLVLQQELVLFGAKLRFTRLNSEQCQEVRDVVDQYVRQQIPVAESKRAVGPDRPVDPLTRRPAKSGPPPPAAARSGRPPVHGGPLRSKTKVRGRVASFQAGASAAVPRRSGFLSVCGTFRGRS